MCWRSVNENGIRSGRMVISQTLDTRMNRHKSTADFPHADLRSLDWNREEAESWFWLGYKELSKTSAFKRKNRQAARGTVRHLKYEGATACGRISSQTRHSEPRPVSTIAGADSHLQQVPAQTAPLLTIPGPAYPPAPGLSTLWLRKNLTVFICHLVHLHPLNSASTGSCCYSHCFGPERLANSGFWLVFVE